MVYVWHMQLLNKWKLLFGGQNFKIPVIQDMTSEIQFKQLLNTFNNYHKYCRESKDG